MPSYAGDIMLLDQTLSETRLVCRSVFSHTFLLMAAKKSVDWVGYAAWYAGHLAG